MSKRARFSEFAVRPGGNVYLNLDGGKLIEMALARGEGKFSEHGVLVVTTGRHTGRLAKDKFIVRDLVTIEDVWRRTTNKPMSKHGFAALQEDFFKHIAALDDLFVPDLFGGSQPAYRVGVRVVTEQAWHSHFARTMLVRPTALEMASFNTDYMLVDLSSFKADPARCEFRLKPAMDSDAKPATLPV